MNRPDECTKCTVKNCLWTEAAETELLKTCFVCPRRDLIELKNRAKGNLDFDVKEFEENFKAVVDKERVWFECRKCGKRFASDAELIKFALEIVKHKFIIDSSVTPTKSTEE